MSRSWQPWEACLMRRLIRLASAKKGRTFPNPVVAAAVVKEGQVLATGVHARSGSAHAEVLALNKAGDLAVGSTVYVTLEPCTHWGQTPPCTDALIAAKVARVIYAVKDPNPDVRQHPAEDVLSAAHLKVATGLCEKEARRANEIYFKNRVTRRPFVTLKAATTLDGRIALGNGKSQYLTGELSRKAVHRLRATADAILVGANTVIRDDPRLTVRPSGGTQPLKIVLDSQLRTPTGAKLFADGAAVLLVSQKNATQKAYSAQTKILQVSALKAPDFWPTFLDALYRDFGICHLLIEGGQQVFTSALESGIVDKVECFVSPQFLMASDAISVVSGRSRSHLAEALCLQDIAVRRYGDDVRISGYLQTS